MADLRSHPEQDEEHEGASPGELLIEACRRNNTDLLLEVISACGSAEKAALLLNETKTVMGNYIYHEAALRGNYEIIDLLLDQEGFECDPISRVEGDTPLHSCIRYINSLPLTPQTSEFAHDIIAMMIDAGSDPRIKNKAQLSPYTLTDPRNEKLRMQLMDAVDIMLNAGDFIEEKGDGFGADGEGEELPDDYAGSASDSDFDAEEYRREREREKKKEREGMGIANGGS